jgi:hypothetical protein
VILQGEIYGDLARVRRPEKVWPVHVQELQERMKIVDVGELTVWPLRPAASPGVLADRPVTLGESLELSSQSRPVSSPSWSSTMVCPLPEIPQYSPAPLSGAVPVVIALRYENET